MGSSDKMSGNQFYLYYFIYLEKREQKFNENGLPCSGPVPNLTQNIFLKKLLTNRAVTSDYSCTNPSLSSTAVGNPLTIADFP